MVEAMAEIRMLIEVGLMTEAEGILSWAVRGAELWYDGGLGGCEAVNTATAEYRSASDYIAEFLDEMCKAGHYKRGVSAGELYEAYATWARRNMKDAVDNTAFKAGMERKGHLQKRDGPGKYWKDLMLRGEIERERKFG